jgi:hypothetical protein
MLHLGNNKGKQTNGKWKKEKRKEKEKKRKRKEKKETDDGLISLSCGFGS